jgi:hypothetical protein
MKLGFQDIEDVEAEIADREELIGGFDEEGYLYSKDNFFFDLRCIVEKDDLSFDRTKRILDKYSETFDDQELLAIRTYMFWYYGKRADCLDDILDYVPSWMSLIYPKIRKRIREEQRNQEWKRAEKLLEYYNKLSNKDPGKAVYDEVEQNLFEKQETSSYPVTNGLPYEEMNVLHSSDNVSHSEVSVEVKEARFGPNNRLWCMGKQGVFFEYDFQNEEILWKYQCEYGLIDFDRSSTQSTRTRITGALQP